MRKHKQVWTVAIFIFAMLISLAPAIRAQEEDALAAATKMYQREEYEPAIELLRGYIDELWKEGNQEAKVAEAYFLLAKIYFETRDDDMVEQMLLEVFELFPDFKKAESNAAFAAFFEKVKKDPLAKVRKFVGQQEYAQAAPLLVDFIEKNRALEGRKGEVADAYYLLAKLYYLQEDDAKMNETLTKLFGFYPDFAKEEADEGFSEAVKRIQSDPLAQAQAYYQQRDYAHAVPALKDFIEKNRLKMTQKENVAEAYYLLAKIYYHQRSDEQMKAALVKLFTAFPEFDREEANAGFKAAVEKVRQETVK